MTAALVGTAPSTSGAAPLVEVINTLLAEVRLAGSGGRPSPAYLRRRRFIGMVTLLAEEDPKNGTSATAGDRMGSRRAITDMLASVA